MAMPILMASVVARMEHGGGVPFPPSGSGLASPAFSTRFNRTVSRADEAPR
jgi:hypothetical protein